MCDLAIFRTRRYESRRTDAAAGVAPEQWTAKENDPYFRGRALDQYSVSAVSSDFRNHLATSSSWKGRSPHSRSRLSNSVISPAVLGFLILFTAFKM